jgi:hypothetical protein
MAWPGLIQNRLIRTSLLSALFAAVSAHAAVTLQSPADHQVFQRQTRQQGTILVRGRSSEPCDRAEVRLAANKWQRLAIESNDSNCTFHAEVPAPAGGWYTLQVRVLKRRQTLGTAAVQHVGVGEVFVIAGQSNSTNYGEELQQTRTRMVSTFGGAGWRLADDPQPGVQDNSRKGSFLPAFGDALYERYHVPVAVASVGSGSTSVRQWLPKGDRFGVPPTAPKFVVQVGPEEWESDGTLFNGMLERITQLGRGGFRALLWHQGESDAHQPAGHNIAPREYGRMMERLIRESRLRAGWEFPWFVARVSYHSPADVSAPEIREVQASLWKTGLALAGPDTDTLTNENRQNGGRGIHMSAKGLQAHGSLWAVKVSEYLDRVLPNGASPVVPTR